MTNHNHEVNQLHRNILLVGVVAILLGVLSISLALRAQENAKDAKASEITDTTKVAGVETTGLDNPEEEPLIPTDTPAAGGTLKTASLVADPTTGPSPTPATIGDRADVTDTDNYVNGFLKGLLAAGDHSWGAAGSWWGDTKHANEDQLWVVVKDVKPGMIVQPGQAVSKTFTCLMPGKVAGKGTGPNRFKLPKLRFQIGSRNPYPTAAITSTDQLEKWVTLTNSNFPATGSIELRTDCLAKYDPALVDPALAKDEIHVNFDTLVWMGSKGGSPNDGNHVGVAVDDNNNGKIDSSEKIKDLIDSHGWYTDIGYIYTVMNNPLDLMGKKVSGTIKVTGWAFKSGNTTTIPIHHHGVKIEQDNEDYWMDSQYVSPPTGGALANSFIQRSSVTFSIDTTKLKNGWHIVSYHAHAIDERTGLPVVKQLKQLADEVKIPVCVDNPGNPNAGQCNGL